MGWGGEGKGSTRRAIIPTTMFHILRRTSFHAPQMAATYLTSSDEERERLLAEERARQVGAWRRRREGGLGGGEA